MSTSVEQIRKAAAKIRDVRRQAAYGDGRAFERFVVALLDAETLADLMETEADAVERTGRVKPTVWALAQDIEGYNVI